MRILEIEMVSADLEALFSFYTGKLGLQADFSADGSRLHLYAGETRLIFKKISNLRTCYHFAFEIPYLQVEDVYKEMKNKLEILPITETSFITDFATWNARSFYFYDPSGNIVECIGRADAEIPPQKPPINYPIFYVSEIGIVTPDVTRTVASFQQQYGVPVFSKQAPMADFSAIGTDGGLFIVVSENRPWYPTAVRSASFPLCIVFEQDGKVHEWASG